MPNVSRFFLNCGLIWLVISMLFFGLQQTYPGLQIAYHHTLGLGWVTQMIIGVAVWMFPRWSPEHPKGPMWIWWAVLFMLNVGLVIRIIAESFLDFTQGFASALLIASGILLWLSLMTFIVIIWRRVKPRSVS